MKVLTLARNVITSYSIHYTKLYEPLSRNALTLARDPDFWRYLENIGLAAVSGEVEESHSKQYIYRTCAVASPHELDRDSAAARLYRSQIIRPFLAWIQAH